MLVSLSFRVWGKELFSPTLNSRNTMAHICTMYAERPVWSRGWHFLDMLETVGQSQHKRQKLKEEVFRTEAEKRSSSNGQLMNEKEVKGISYSQRWHQKAVERDASWGQQTAAACRWKSGSTRESTTAKYCHRTAHIRFCLFYSL